jgi:hypothetical protein
MAISTDCLDQVKDIQIQIFTHLHFVVCTTSSCTRYWLSNFT